MIDIRRCSEAEVPQLMAFIDAHWRKGHALASSRALMDWQHRDEAGHYNYLTAWQDAELLGVLGYIPTRRHDPALAGQNVLWLALWKVREDCRIPGLGLRMLRALEQVEPHVAMAVNGITVSLPPLYKALGYRVAELSQSFMVDPDQPRHLLQGQGALPHARPGAASCTALSENDLQRLDLASPAMPGKTPRYFSERFLRHPFYRYRVCLLEHDRQRALVALRVASHEGGHALRIVDFAGDARVLAHSGSAFLGLMRDAGAEYADFWQYGLPQEALASAGFAVVAADGPVIVPNFFEPFVARNGRILCAWKSASATPFVICRADGDQDRPSAVEAA